MRPPPTSNQVFDKINVVPIIDVALVLVIILLFMSPMLTVADTAVTLPDAEARGVEDSDAISITVGRDGRVSVADEELPSLDTLQPVLRAHLSARGEGKALVVVRADAGLSHAQVREIMEEARAAGASRLAVAVRQKGGSAR